jgi:hypothetical protein
MLYAFFTAPYWHVLASDFVTYEAVPAKVSSVWLTNGADLVRGSGVEVKGEKS